MADNPASMDPGVAHLRAVQAEADAVTDESLSATRRMLATAEETREVGAKTLQELDEQGDKLRKVNQDLNEINHDMKAAEKTLTQMEKCCGCCTCCGSKNFEKSSSTYKETWEPKQRDGGEEAGIVTEQPGRGVASARYTGGSGGGGGGGQYINRVTNDAREDEMESNLSAVHDILGDLKAQAKAMGTEIDDQNEMIVDIDRKAQSNDERVKAAELRAAKILKSTY